METFFPDPVRDVIAAREASAQAALAPSELGREDFLRLLIAQLENQDPMQPAKDTEFVAQLATFSSLEQLISANERLDALGVGQASLINAQALDLIGKNALVEAGGTVRVDGGVPEQLVYVVPRPLESVTLGIRAADGTLLRTFELENSPNGRITLDWDGTDEQGVPLANGSYDIVINATDSTGAPAAIALFKSLPIDGVNFSSEGIALVSGDREIPFGMIMEIRAGN